MPLTRKLAIEASAPEVEGGRTRHVRHAAVPVDNFVSRSGVAPVHTTTKSANCSDKTPSIPQTKNLEKGVLRVEAELSPRAVFFRSEVPKQDTTTRINSISLFM